MSCRTNVLHRISSSLTLTTLECAPGCSRRSTCGRGRLLLLGQENVPAVLRPARLVVVGALRPLLAVGDDADPPGLDPSGHEIAHGGVGAPLTQSQVVLVGAALVTVPFDQGELVGVRLEPLGAGVQRPRVAGADLRRV